MKRQELCNITLSEILDLLGNLEPNERLWIIDNQLPQYICTQCGDHITDCGHGDET